MTVKIRLYVDHPLGAGQTVLLNRDQAHYLFGVMRQSLGAQVALFNGREGEWRAEVSQTGKRTGALRCLEQTRPLQMPPDLWLLFAPIKKARTDFIVEKATELGVCRFCQCKLPLLILNESGRTVYRHMQSRQQNNVAARLYLRCRACKNSIPC